MQFNALSPSVCANAQRYSTMIAEAIAQGRWDLPGIVQGSGRAVGPAPSTKPIVSATLFPPASKPGR